MGVPLSEGSFLCVPPLRSSRGPLPLQREVQDLTGPDPPDMLPVSRRAEIFKEVPI